MPCSQLAAGIDLTHSLSLPYLKTTTGSHLGGCPELLAALLQAVANRPPEVPTSFWPQLSVCIEDPSWLVFLLRQGALANEDVVGEACKSNRQNNQPPLLEFSPLQPLSAPV